MAVTRDEVIHAYRLILGRYPESEEVIGHARGVADVPALRETFLSSDEFAESFGLLNQRQPRVGRLLDIDQLDIDLTCSADQLQVIFGRIGAAWQDFGRTDPHWSVLTNDIYRSGNISHTIDDFYLTGVSEIETLLNFLKRANLPTTLGRALDFGCGVGRLSLALSPYARTVTGVDISPPHLELAKKRASEKGIANVNFQVIASIADLDRFRDYDLIVSRIVLQHNPPPVMAAIYARLLAALAPGGTAIVQMPTYIHGQSFHVHDYLNSAQPQMEMNYLPQDVIFGIIEEAGCRVLEVREDSSVGSDAALSHTFCVQKR